MSEATNAGVLQELSRAQRDSQQRSLPPVAPEPEPVSSVDETEPPPTADPMPEDPAAEEQRKTTPRVTRSQAKGK